MKTKLVAHRIFHPLSEGDLVQMFFFVGRLAIGLSKRCTQAKCKESTLLSGRIFEGKIKHIYFKKGTVGARDKLLGIYGSPVPRQKLSTDIQCPFFQKNTLFHFANDAGRKCGKSG